MSHVIFDVDRSLISYKDQRREIFRRTDESKFDHDRKRDQFFFDFCEIMAKKQYFISLVAHIINIPSR